MASASISKNKMDKKKSSFEKLNSSQHKIRIINMNPFLNGGSCKMKSRPGLPFRSAIAMK